VQTHADARWASRRSISGREPLDEKHARILLDVVDPGCVEPMPAIDVVGGPGFPVAETLVEPTGPGIGECDPESDAAPAAIDRELLEVRDQEPTDAPGSQWLRNAEHEDLRAIRKILCDRSVARTWPVEQPVTDGAQTLPRHHISDAALGLLDEAFAVTRRRMQRKLLLEHSEVSGVAIRTRIGSLIAGAFIRT
jgi:hypothetical protein